MIIKNARHFEFDIKFVINPENVICYNNERSSGLLDATLHRRKNEKVQSVNWSRPEKSVATLCAEKLDRVGEIRENILV
jgi:hypothetical protein